MKTLRLAAIAAVLLPVQLLAQENPISFSYIGLGYQMGEVDAAPADIETSGMTLDGSMEVANHGHLFGDFGRWERDDAEDVDTDVRTLGGGVHFHPFGRFSVYSRFGFAEVNADANLGLADAGGSDDGLYLSGGVRFMLTDRLELRGSMEYLDLDTLGEQESVSLGGDFYLTDVVTLTFGADVYDDASVFRVGARLYPGNDPGARRR